jgi:peptide/nickel transport system substrate-binding protein
MNRAWVGALLVAAVACRARPEKPAAAKAPATPIPASGAGEDKRGGPPADGGLLRRRLFGEPTTLNAVMQSSTPEAHILQYVQRNLLDFDAGMKLVPSLAERWDVSPNGLSYTFTLRPDAVWEDGRSVTARDAVFTIRQIADPKVPSNVFKPVFEDLVSVEEVDGRTFRAVFREPYAFRAMAFVLPILPAHRFAGKDFLRAGDNRAPLSNGPYRFVDWKTGESVELERNPRYWGEPGHFDRILFRILPDNTTAWRVLTDGALDVDQIDAELKARAAVAPGFRSCCRLVEFYNLDYNYITLNNRSPLFADARVRRAMTMLSDRDGIVRNLYRGSARVISGPWAPESPAYDPRVAPLPFDPAAAKALLAEAGWRDTDGDRTLDRAGRRFEFELLVSAGSEIGRQIDEMLAAELARVGVRARVRPLEWAAFVDRVDSGDFEAASLAGSAVDPNPDPYFSWHSSQCAPQGLNSGCYRSTEADRLMAEARREMDPVRRTELYHRLHRIFRDDAPAIFVVNATQKFALARRIQGVTTSPLGLFGIWPGPLGWWAAPEAAAGKRAA